MQSIVKGTLAGATAAGATYTYVSYPSGKTPGHFKTAQGHKLALARELVREIASRLPQTHP